MKKSGSILEKVRDPKIIIMCWGFVFLIFSVVLGLKTFSILVFILGLVIGSVFCHFRKRDTYIYINVGGLTGLLFGLLFGLKGGFTERGFDVISFLTKIICPNCGWMGLLYSFILTIIIFVLLGAVIGHLIGKIIFRKDNHATK